MWRWGRWGWLEKEGREREKVKQSARMRRVRCMVR